MKKMQRRILWIVSVLLLGCNCSPHRSSASSGCDGTVSRSFLVRGVYAAEKTGFQMTLISAGYVKPGEDVSRKARELVQICPIGGRTGSEVRIALTVGDDMEIFMDAEDNGPALSWNSRTTEKVLRSRLTKAGYADLNSAELTATAATIEGALGGPKSCFLNGQVVSIAAIDVDIEYCHKLDLNQSQDKWISPALLPACNQ